MSRTRTSDSRKLAPHAHQLSLRLTSETAELLPKLVSATTSARIPVQSDSERTVLAQPPHRLLPSTLAHAAQTARLHAMPTATLSLELQLRILDFAVPPRTFYNRGERERICRDLALVHYTWETRALSLLRQHAEYRGEDLSDWRAMYRGPKEAIAAGAKRFDISLGWNAVVDTRRPAPNTFGSGAAGLEELGLRRTTRRLTRGADFASEFFA